MKLSYRWLLAFIVTPLLYAEAEEAPQHLSLYKALCSGDEKKATEAMDAAQGGERYNNAFFELCDAAIRQGDVDFFAKLPTAYLNELCGPVASPFAGMDGNPKVTAYFAPPLMHAASAGKPELVRVLLQRGANIEAAEYYDRTAIVYAAANGHLPCVKLLHLAGAENLELALQAALLFNRTEVVEYLQCQGVKQPAICAELSQRTPTGETELMRAVAEGDAERVAYVLQYAPQLLNMQNSYGETALMRAVLTNDLSILSQLIACGAELGIKNDYGLTALDEAYQEANPDVVETLTQAGAPAAQPQLALRYACTVGDVELARRLLFDGGGDVAARDEKQRSLLALSVESQSAPLVQLLIEHGCRVKDAEALHAAVKTDQPDFVRLFMAHAHLCPRAERSPGAEFSEQEKRNALLHAACRSDAVLTAQMLLKMGADVNDTRMSAAGHARKGNTPLHAAVSGSEELINLLLDSGADINARNKDGDTPLILAIKLSVKEPYIQTGKCVSLLLERGADAALLNAEKMSAADYARDMRLVLTLEKAGVKPKQPEQYLEPLVLPYLTNDKEEFCRLLQSGANPDALCFGETLLQNLLREDGEAEYARLLIAAGADVQRCSDAFAIAMGRASTAVARAVLEGGLKVQPRSVQTREYLSRALNGSGPQYMLPLLLQAGADINAEDARGCTLLMELAMSDYVIEHRLNVLLQMQPDLEIPLQGSTAEWNGLTALGIAVKYDNLEMAYRILLAGAKATPQQVQAIFFHVLREYPEQAELMLSRYGASPTAPESSTGLTPTDLASRSGNATLLSILKSAQ